MMRHLRSSTLPRANNYGPDLLFSFPHILLLLFGFLRSNGDRPFAGKIAQIICGVHVTGGCAYLVMLLVRIADDVRHSFTSASINVFLNALAWTPFIASFIRSFLVLLLFLSSAKAYRSLCHAFLSFTKSVSSHSEIYRWRRMASALGGSTLCLNICWHFARQFQRISDATAPTVNQPGNATPMIEQPNNTYQALIIPTVKYSFYYFEICLFCLSQQVVVLGVVLALALRFFFAQNNTEIAATDNSKTAPSELAFGLFSIILYCGYSTIYLPLVRVHEEAESTNWEAYRLWISVWARFPNEALDSAILGTLDSILTSTEPDAVVIRGAGVVRFIRQSFAIVLTYMLSFSVFAYQIGQKTSPHILLDCGHLCDCLPNSTN
ncbi:hypothetical protein BV898_12164 [Hypsibius exemplaris]|uniref:Uncharacterized protein n=1 Tax=Hypsibius exemplaris TaxID=2072580 RepID=A0A1W0WEI2_HYPEX|nr:hypothetical protein BV898_12164 [Hypsibius exemplaris]